jgi:hypothetical protein
VTARTSTGCDQTDKAIFKVALPGYAVSRLATVPPVDLLTLLPGGDLLTGGGPAIARITQCGEVSTLPGPVFEQVRGLAYDAHGKRLFGSTTARRWGCPASCASCPSSSDNYTIVAESAQLVQSRAQRVE